MTLNPKDRPRLGRGINSLLSPTAAPPAAPAPEADTTLPHARVLEIPVDQVRPNPHQPRREFNEAALAALAESMKAAGVIQPIIVRQAPDGYELIAGERRLRAARLAGLSVIPAIVRETDPITQAQLALIENIQREDLNPIERAEAYRTLVEQLGLTQQELALRLGEDRSSIANYLRLLDLPQAAREYIRTGALSMGHAKVLMGILEPAEQARLAALAVQESLSVRNLERIVSHGQTDDRPRPTRPAPSAHIQDLEKTLQRHLGMRVQLRTNPRNRGKGKLIIHYADLDQFDQLLARLGVQIEE